MDDIHHDSGGEARYRTTLYMDNALASALKAVAARTRRPLNGLITEAVRALVANYESSQAPDGEPSLAADISIGLRRDLDRLSARLDVLEAGLRGTAAPPHWQDPRPRLTPSQVRHEVRSLILARGAPIPHRELLAILEARFILPGKRPTENLRTILTHIKASGFKLIHRKGYDVDPATRA